VLHCMEEVDVVVREEHILGYNTNNIMLWVKKKVQ
jgi:hypothetical protein